MPPSWTTHGGLEPMKRLKRMGIVSMKQFLAAATSDDLLAIILISFNTSSDGIDWTAAGEEHHPGDTEKGQAWLKRQIEDFEQRAVALAKEQAEVKSKFEQQKKARLEAKQQKSAQQLLALDSKDGLGGHGGGD